MKKTDYKHGKFTILSSQIDTEVFDREDYIDFCEVNGIEPGDEDDFYDWCAEETHCNYEADLENIKYCKAYNVPVVLTGTLGLWWGHPTINPERHESVIDALDRCIEGSGGDVVIVQYEDGVINVEVRHHDGCNCFTIRALSKKGSEKKYAEYEEHDFKRLPYLYAI